MKYCTICKKLSNTRIKISKWFYNKCITYEREVCAGCQSELLIDHIPKDTSKIKIPWQEKRRAKRYEQRMYTINERMSNGWPSLG
jgi:hypothetical protein